MRTKLRGLVAGLAGTVTVVAVAVVVQAATGPAQAAAADPYTFKNVQIEGGGFVPGIIFNQGRPNVVYARTDIGGAYRLDAATNRWVPLLDWVGQDNWGYNGVVSLATDAVAPDKVYAAVGMYTNSWDPNNGAILRSSDQGATWQATPLPFKLGGNMPGRGQGERLAIDPNKNSVLYFGAPSGNGLWRSVDSGVTWSKVTAFPNPGTYVQDPNDTNGYLNDNQGVTWVTFDKRTGTSGGVTQSIYVGVADKNNPVYRSTDGGATWAPLAGQPTGYLAHKGVLDTAGGNLYIATSDTGGPYDGGKGDVWKYATATGVWTRISPIPSSSSDDYFGYSGLTVDRQHPGTLMVATQVSWWPDVIFFRSTDSGATWTRIWDFTSYPNRSLRYKMDISRSPWLTFGLNPQPPETAPKLGWMTESMEIDPFNANRFMYGTGATLYGSTDLTSWDTGGQFTVKPMAAGIEETAVLDLISPPAGAPLISGLGDIGGFRHTNLDAVPAMMFTAPSFTTTTSLDYAEQNPAVMVRAGNFTDSDRPGDSHAAFSTDGGANWFQGTEPGGINEGGTIAAAADGSRFVWAPKNSAVVFSVGYGNTWTQSAGLPQNAVVESDRVNPNIFYGLANGTFYVSRNGGATFTAAATGLPGTGTFKAVPGVTGEIWLAGGTSGLLRSTDAGATFTKLATVQAANAVGFGKAAPGRGNVAVYAVAQVDGKKGVYRSDDSAGSWLRINDDQHQYGNIGDTITGDPRVYGRVYLGTNGRGIIYGDRTGAPASSYPASPSVSPSRSASVSPSASRSPSASASASASASNGAACAVTYTVTGQWGGNFQGAVKVTNRSAAAVNGWSLKWTFADGQVISQIWGGVASHAGGDVTVTDAGYNKTITAGGTADFGFIAGWNNSSNRAPVAFSLNGTSCALG